MPTHPFFIATQAHPEFQSRPDQPHPLFSGLIKAAAVRSDAGERDTPIQLDELARIRQK